MRARKASSPSARTRLSGSLLGEEQEAHALAVLQVRQHRLQGAPGRLAAGLVAVETEQDARYQAEQALDVFLAGRRAEGRHRVADALLGQGDDIHVALDHHDLVEVAILLPGFVESVEFLALVEDRSLRGVQVLRLVVAEHPAAEGDDPPAAVADREHHAIAEAVVALAGVAVLHQQAGVEHGLELQVVATQVLEQVVPARRGEAEAEVAGDLAGQAAALQVVHRGLARRVAFQRLLVELGGGAEQRVERRVGRLARRVPASAAFLARHVHAGALGQFLDRLGELQLVVVHDEAERVAAGAAAEAVVELLVRADGERGSLFLVERAAGAVVLAGFLQLDARTHHLDDVGAVQQVIDEALRYQAGHGVLENDGAWAQSGSIAIIAGPIRPARCFRRRGAPSGAG